MYDDCGIGLSVLELAMRPDTTPEERKVCLAMHNSVWAKRMRDIDRCIALLQEQQFPQ